MSRPPRRMVALILGQSNFANHGPVPGDAGPGVQVLVGGRLFPAHDPLPGATGDGGSVWTRLAPLLIANQAYDEIILVPAAIAGTAIANWAPGGTCHQHVQAVIAEMAASGIAATHVLWHQGERDTLLRTRGADYRRDFTAMVGALRRAGLSAPIILCVASYRFGETNPEVRAVQRDMVDPVNGILAGPDTDAIGPELRYDDCHFNEDGQRQLARLLAEKLAAADRDASQGFPPFQNSY